MTSPAFHTPSEDETKAVFAVLSRYFKMLESGTAGRVRPRAHYTWRFYEGEMTLKRMREGVKRLDDYLGALPQFNWVQHNNAHGMRFTAGPELGRLPDGALIAMIQDLDAAQASSRTAPPPFEGPI